MSSIDRTLTPADLPGSGDTRLVATGGSRWKSAEFLSGAHTHPELVQPSLFSVRTTAAGPFRVNIADTQFYLNPDCASDINIGSSPDWTMPVPYTLMYHGLYPMDVQFTLTANLTAQTLAGDVSIGLIKNTEGVDTTTAVALTTTGRSLIQHSGVQHVSRGDYLQAVIFYSQPDNIIVNRLSLELVCVRSLFDAEGTQPLSRGSRVTFATPFATPPSRVQASLSYFTPTNITRLDAPAVTNITVTGFDLAVADSVIAAANSAVLSFGWGTTSGTSVFFHSGWSRYVVAGVSSVTNVFVWVSGDTAGTSWPIQNWSIVLASLPASPSSIIVLRHKNATQDRIMLMACVGTTVYYRRSSSDTATSPTTWATQTSYAMPGADSSRNGIQLAVRSDFAFSLTYMRFYSRGTNAANPVFGQNHAVTASVSPNFANTGAAVNSHLGFPAFLRHRINNQWILSMMYSSVVNPNATNDWAEFFIAFPIGNNASTAWTYSSSLGYVFLWHQLGGDVFSTSPGPYTIGRIATLSGTVATVPLTAFGDMDTNAPTCQAIGNFQLNASGTRATVIIRSNAGISTLVTVTGDSTKLTVGTDIILQELTSLPGLGNGVAYSTGDHLLVHAADDTHSYFCPIAGQVRYRAIK